MSSTDLSTPEKDYLLGLARDSIHARLVGDDYTPPPPPPGPIQEEGCAFVTLKSSAGELRGCIGALEPYQILYRDVMEHAQAAAFRDFRFPSVTLEEFPSIKIEISVLSPLVEIQCKDEADLIRQLVPNVDGLTIDDGAHRATFLPKVWEQLPDKQDFLNHLKQKAGMAPDSWPSYMQCYRYRAFDFAEHER